MSAENQEYNRRVEASPEVLADLWEAEERYDSYGLADYARSIGLTPPPEPAGFTKWAIVVSYEDEDLSKPLLYWWGPEDNPGDADLPDWDDSGDLPEGSDDTPPTSPAA